MFPKALGLIWDTKGFGKWLARQAQTFDSNRWIWDGYFQSPEVCLWDSAHRKGKLIAWLNSSVSAKR